MKSATSALPARPVAGRYSYVEREHDTGVVGYGGTLERAFEGAAEAIFALIADLSQVRAERTLPVSFIEADDARALLRWLGLLFDAAREHRIVFSEFHLQRERGRWWGCATGARRTGSPDRDVSIERASGAVVRTAQGWEASCTVRCRPRVSLPAHQPVSRREVVSETGS